MSHFFTTTNILLKSKTNARSGGDYINASSLTNMDYKRFYFENAVLCGECTGAGCKRCDHGIESFWEYNYNHRGEDPIMIGVTYSAAVKELQNKGR